MKKIRQWIQKRRDERFRRRLQRVLSDEVFLEQLQRVLSDEVFLEQLQRVLHQNKVMASPVFDGYLVTTGDIMAIGKTNKPLDRIRYDIEHPFPTIIEVGDALPVKAI